MLVIEKDILKDALRDLIHEEPNTFKTILKELLEESTQQDIFFEKSLQNNFERFDNTFRALA